jgi:beta-glucosidase
MWRSVGSGTVTSALVMASIGSQTARYVRITQTGSASSWSIAELDLYT